MKSITIHNLDEKLEKLIEREARQKGMSLNKTIKSILRQALGLTQKDTDRTKEEFMELFGVWTEADFAEFSNKVRDFDQIDPKDWE